MSINLMEDFCKKRTDDLYHVVHMRQERHYKIFHHTYFQGDVDIDVQYYDTFC